MRATHFLLACFAALSAFASPPAAGPAAPRQRAARGFAAPRCLIPGYPQAVAFREPARAGALRSCLLLSAGRGRPADDGAGDAPELTPAETCPGLVLLREGRGGRLDKIVLAVPARSRLRETSDCCGFDLLAVRRDRDGLRLRLRSRGPSADCFGGSARTVLEEVFLLKGTRLTLEKDNSRYWQLTN